ncbi:MAG: M3 family metallopeptidase [Bacteroidales bacterium]|nr:M3 family metallopeptidase [Bacteroidales bacterium]
MVASCTPKKDDSALKENPFFTEWNTPFGVPEFEKIKPEHYKPAFIEGMAQQNKEIEAIVNNPQAPTFENTIAALDFSGKLLLKVGSVFDNLTSAETNDSLRAIDEEVSPLLSEHSDNIMLNEKLFQRIKSVYDNKESENLTGEQLMVLDNYYKDFVRSGSLLDAQKKDRLKEINKELGLLSIKFANNVLGETNDFKLVIDNKDDLAGLPDWAVAAAEEQSGEKGKYVFTLQKPSLIPFLQYADNRSLREKMYKGYIMRGDNNNERDNKQVISQILKLRLEKAKLLGFDSFADFTLDNKMAKNPSNVYDLLNKIWNAALPKAKEEASALQNQINKEGGNFKLAAWDWWYYTEKIRKEKYGLDESEIKPYFAVDSVRNGAFMVANKLWGITFKELNDMPVYNLDVKAFEVDDKDGSLIGIFYVDYFPRDGKRAGAWMSNYRDQSRENGENIRPIIVNVGNFSKPVGDAPALLNIDEVQTLFHEFGHALHGLLTQCTYPSVSGTSVARDFVELPSQIMEHWSTNPQVLKMYAKHYKTGEVIPDALIEKMEKASNFNTGFTTTELVAAALLDMDYHTNTNLDNFDAIEFEKATTKKIGLIDEITYRYRGSYFSHIFSGGYATGYYSYLWAEVLDADAFDAFVQNGIFDQKTAQLYRENILEKGGSVEPMTLYKQFRGAEPNPDALLRNRGLKN